MITLTLLFVAGIAMLAVALPLLIVGRVLGALLKPLLIVLVPLAIVGMVLGFLGRLIDARGIALALIAAGALVYFTDNARSA